MARIGECTGNLRSTPTPKLTLRTVKAPEHRIPRAEYRALEKLHPVPVALDEANVDLELSPGSKAGISSRRPSRSMMSVGFMARRLLEQGFPGPGQDSPAPNDSSRASSAAVSRPWPPAGRADGRSGQGLGVAPSGDAPVVARAEDLGDAPAPELGRPGVVGILEQAGGEGLVAGRLVVAHDARHQPGDRLHDHEGGRLPPGEDEVADRQLAVDQVAADPLVDPLVTAAQEREPGGGGQLGGQALVEAASAGVEQEQGPGGSTASTAANTGSADSTIPGPPPKGESSTERCLSVVIPQVVDPDVDHRPFPRPAQQPPREGRLQDLGQHGEDVDPHGVSATVAQKQRYIKDAALWPR